MSVRVEKDGQVTTVILARPEVRNAVDRATADALSDAFDTFDKDPAQHVAVLYGEGGHFCAGADLKALSVHDDLASDGLHANGLHANGLHADGLRANQGPLGPTRWLLSKPVIAAVSGYAVAGGLELALWCDLRVVEATATFGVFCRRFGVPLIDGGTVRLPRLVGMGRALDLILTGRPVGADEALAIGLATRVVAPGEALAAAQALARELAALPQVCLRADRASAYVTWDKPIGEALREEFRRGLKVIASGETLDGARRFAQGAGRHGSKA